jgi:hypothetical protein
MSTWTTKSQDVNDMKTPTYVRFTRKVYTLKHQHFTSTARVLLTLRAGAAGQLTTELHDLRAYLYCLSAKNLQTSMIKRRNGDGNIETQSSHSASMSYCPQLI